MLLAAWAALSLGSVPPLDDPTPAERASGGLVGAAAAATLLYAFAGWRYGAMAIRSGSHILLAVASACVLLAEAMIAVAFARNWHASWWEWHVLMVLAFGAIAWSARREEGEERFSDLYLDETAAGKREVSVLFADLEGFTRFSEGRDPREVSEMLNAYLRIAIPPIVDRHGGEVDRLVGDAIMATWGTRGDQPEHARQAVEAALELQAETVPARGREPGLAALPGGRQQRRGDGRRARRRERSQLHGHRRHGQPRLAPSGGGARRRRRDRRGHAARAARRERALARRARGQGQAGPGAGLPARRAPVSPAEAARPSSCRVMAQSRSSSSVKRTSQIQVVRPRWSATPSAWTLPAVTGRRKVVLFDWPTAKLPSSSTAAWVAIETIDSASAA